VKILKPKIDLDSKIVQGGTKRVNFAVRVLKVQARLSKHIGVLDNHNGVLGLQYEQNKKEAKT
jgi:hypothetical protein